MCLKYSTLNEDIVKKISQISKNLVETYLICTSNNTMSENMVKNINPLVPNVQEKVTHT